MSDSSIMNPSIILAKAASLLPSSNEFRLKSPAAVLTVLIHAVQLSHGFKLADSKDHAEQTLPQSLFDSQNWKLKYSHPQSRVGFELVVTVLGPRLLVNGMDDKDNKTRTMDILTTDYFSLSSLPVEATSLVETFTTENKCKDLIALYLSSILSPLVPDLTNRPDVQTEPTIDNTRLSDDRTRRNVHPDPTSGRPFPTSDVPRPAPGPSTGMMPPIGRSDLDPLAGLDGTSTGHVPLGTAGADGMMLGPDHPLFRDRFAQPAQPFSGTGAGPFGGDGFLPPGAVPPGARFDPIVPGHVPGPGPAGRFPPPGRRGGFSGPGSFGGLGSVRRSGDPDNDEFLPPVRPSLVHSATGSDVCEPH